MQLASCESEQLGDSPGAVCGQEVVDDLRLGDQTFGPACPGSETASACQLPAEDHKWRVSNRNSQKRYRERQRDLKQRQAAERDQQQSVIKDLSHSNAALADRNTHLEQLLRLALQHQLPQPSACPNQQQPRQQLAKRNEKGWLEPLIFEEGKAALLNIRGPYVLCRDRLSDVSLEQFQPLLKGLVSCLRRGLALCRAAPGPLAFQQIEVAVSQFLFVCWNMHHSNMMLARELLSSDLDTCCPVATVPDERWVELLDALSLSRDQKRQLVAACDKYLAALGPVFHQQQVSLGKVEGPLRVLTSRPSIACLRDMNSANVGLMRAIRLEHEAYGQLFLVVTTQVLSPVQVAVLAVRTWPFAPDFIALGSIAEAQLQADGVPAQPSAQDIGQQLWQPMENMGWLDLLPADVPPPSSSAQHAACSQGLHPASSHVQSSRGPPPPAHPLPSTPASIANLSAASAGAALGLEYQLPDWSPQMDDKGHVAAGSAALNIAHQLQHPSAGQSIGRGIEHPRSLMPSSTNQAWYLQRGLEDVYWDGQVPTEDQCPAQRLGPILQPVRGFFTPVHADWQHTETHFRQGKAGMGMPGSCIDRRAVNPLGLLDLEESTLLGLMPN